MIDHQLFNLSDWPELQDPAAEESRCTACGCTDLSACAGGCSWVRRSRTYGIGLCSTCNTGPHRRAYVRRYHAARKEA